MFSIIERIEHDQRRGRPRDSRKLLIFQNQRALDWRVTKNFKFRFVKYNRYNKVSERLSIRNDAKNITKHP